MCLYVVVCDVVCCRLYLATRWTRALWSAHWSRSRPHTSPGSSWSKHDAGRYAVIFSKRSFLELSVYLKPEPFHSIILAESLSLYIYSVIFFVWILKKKTESLSYIGPLLFSGIEWGRFHQQVFRRPYVAGVGKTGCDAQLRHVACYHGDIDLVAMEI